MTSSQPWLTVLILAGGSLQDKQLGPAPALSSNPADLADGSGLARARLHQHFQSIPGLRLRLLRDRNQPPLRPHRCDPQLPPLLIDGQASVIGSLRAALPLIDTPWLLLQPITSLPMLQPEQRCSIELGDQAMPRENWSGVADPKSPTPLFRSRNQPPAHDERPCHPFSGVICAPTSLLRALLPSEGTDLLVLAEQLWQSGEACFRFAPWRDLGHKATYSLSRLSRLSSRSFNDVHYDADNDLIRKCSSDQQRLSHEHRYLTSLPPHLRRYFPALIGSELNGDSPSGVYLELDYIPFPNLAELFLHWRIGPNAWDLIAKRLAKIRSALLQDTPPEPTPAPAAVRWLYSQKLQQRLHELASCPPNSAAVLDGLSWATFWRQPLILQLRNRTGEPHGESIQLPSPERASNSLTKALHALEAKRTLQRIHGDLCFNNILAEPVSGSIRLIDPRGETPAQSTWPVGFGDPRYDLVKLLHSSRYLYDVVCNGLFQLQSTTNRLELQLDVPVQYAEVDRAFQQHLFTDQLTPEEERCLTASLFLSMLPLHSSEPLHCVVFSCIGVLILEDRFHCVLEAGGHLSSPKQS